MCDHKHFIVIIIFYISKNNSYKLSCKSDLMVTYHFGCSTCNSWLLFFKIVENRAYFRGLHRSGLNRAKLVQSGSVSSVFFSFLFHGMVKLQLKVVLKGLVWSRSWALFWTDQRLDWSQKFSEPKNCGLGPQKTYLNWFTVVLD